MISMNYVSKIKPLIGLLAYLLFEIHPAYCQIDTLDNKNQAIKENNILFNKERLSVSLGVFASANNTGITLGSKQAGLGVNINIEDALGLETSSFVYRGTANFRFGNKYQHSLVFDYFRINRRATKVLAADLEWGDYIYPIGTELKSKYNLSIIRLKYEYAFLQDDRVSLGFSAGLYIIPLSFSVKAIQAEEQSTALTAPLPIIGLRSGFLITKKLLLNESAELLYLKIDNFTGSILDLNLAVEHRTFKHFGFGVGFNSNRLDITAKGKDYPAFDFFGTLKMEFTGVILFAKFYL